MWRVTTIMAVTLGCVTGACGSNAARAPVAAPPRVTFGTHAFVASLPGHQISGRLAILRDTIMLESRLETCRPMPGTPSMVSIRYECFDVGRYHRVEFVLDRRSPIQLSRWTAVAVSQERVQVCVRYVRNVDGQLVCIRYDTEYQEVSRQFEGRLNVLRPPDDAHEARARTRVPGMPAT